MDALTPVAALQAMPPEPPKPITHDEAKRIKRCEAQQRYRAKHRASYLPKHREEMRKWRAENPDKSNGTARAYRARNPERTRSHNLKKKYGITLEQFNDLFLSQERKCAICKCSSSTGKNWHVDHCHQAGSIRGILCHSCNLMIGHAGDKTETLLAAVEYLK